MGEFLFKKCVFIGLHQLYDTLKLLILLKGNGKNLGDFYF